MVIDIKTYNNTICILNYNNEDDDDHNYLFLIKVLNLNFLDYNRTQNEVAKRVHICKQPYIKLLIY